MRTAGPTDAQRLWLVLGERGRQGIHSFDIRAELHMGNPSQRIADIERDHDVKIPRTSEMRGDRRGTRYFHPDFPPAGLGGRQADPPRPVAVEPSGVAQPASHGSCNPGEEREAEDLRRRGPGQPAPATAGSHPAAGPSGPERLTPVEAPEAEQLGLIDVGPSIYDAAA